MVMHSSHIWEDVDGAVALRSAAEDTEDGDTTYRYTNCNEPSVLKE